MYPYYLKNAPEMKAEMLTWNHDKPFCVDLIWCKANMGYAEITVPVMDFACYEYFELLGVRYKHLIMCVHVHLVLKIYI